MMAELPVEAVGVGVGASYSGASAIMYVTVNRYIRWTSFDGRKLREASLCGKCPHCGAIHWHGSGPIGERMLVSGENLGNWVAHCALNDGVSRDYDCVVVVG
jgi:hypothetical protein